MVCDIGLYQVKVFPTAWYKCFMLIPTLPNDIVTDHIVPKVMELIMQVKHMKPTLEGIHDEGFPMYL